MVEEIKPRKKRIIPAYTYFVKMLKEELGLPRIDNTAKYNKIYAIQIERCIREEIARVEKIAVDKVASKDVIRGFAKLIKLIDKDPWYRKRATELGFIYRNFGKIIR